MLHECIVATGVAGLAYHHFGYPWILRRLASTPTSPDAVRPPQRQADLPSVCVIVPVFNEETLIAGKVEMLAGLDYPSCLLRCVIVFDGCTDHSVQVARLAAERCAPGRIEIIEHQQNRGKVAVINEAIAACPSEIVVLNDVSAAIAADSIRRAVAHFIDRMVGVVCPTYRLEQAGSEGELAYWHYQVEIKANEAALGSPMGAHGAFYLFRRALWTPLPSDTINDDVILPMRIVAQGYRAVYDREMCAVEIERTSPRQEFKRRVRIGAGNLQQVIRLASLADPRRPGLAFVFLSGKVLRCLCPLLALASFWSLLALASEGSAFFIVSLISGLIVSAIAGFAVLRKGRGLSRPLALMGYLVEGHAASFLGAVRYLCGLERGRWSKAARADAAEVSAPERFVPATVEFSKRCVDVVCALGALALLAILIVPLTIAIKLDSRGPVIYRQLRVGRCTGTATQMFYLFKLRTMHVDSEVATGAVWASKDDPRITRVGRFLRKTRLDELPQAINVLRGEMSVVGPRPERPSFFAKLEDAIPFYVERTYGLRPGITGLAQVNQAYDQSIEDVRNKVLYDHAYAAHLSRWRDWLRSDMRIILKTFTVMALGKGQ